MLLWDLSLFTTKENVPWLGDFSSVMIKLNRFKTLVYPPSHYFLMIFIFCLF